MNARSSVSASVGRSMARDLAAASSRGDSACRTWSAEPHWCARRAANARDTRLHSEKSTGARISRGGIIAPKPRHGVCHGEVISKDRRACCCVEGTAAKDQERRSIRAQQFRNIPQGREKFHDWSTRYGRGQRRNSHRRGPAVAFVLPERGVNLEELERQLVVQALERCGWNQTRAATLLGLNRDQVRYRIEKFGLTAPTPRTTLAFSSTR